jgi:4-amino-4-deoxy-L-arabinose transferase-like glycosyltransferase
VRAAVLGALIAAVITLPGLGNGTLWDNSETVYGEVAREVLLTHDWVVMHLNAEPWFVQPPLFFWIGALCAKIFGATSFAMRLPAALATIAMGGAVGYAVARVAGTRAGTFAALVLSTSLMQAIVGRLAIMDALLDLCVGAAILCWFRAFQRNTEPDAGRRATAFVSGSLALAFGTLAKGPVAPVIVVLVIGMWLLWERRSSASLALPHPLSVLTSFVLFVAIVAPWFVLEAARVGPSATWELIGHYTIGRYTGVIESQSGPWWYYVPVLILGFFPWIAFVPVATQRAIDAARSRDGSIERLALTWAIVPLLFFSVAQTKLPNYIALMMPALAIVVGLWFDRLIDAPGRRWAIVSAATVPVFVALLGIAIALFMGNNHLDAATGVIVPLLEILGVLMLAGALLTVAVIAAPKWTSWTPGVLGATAAAFVLFIAFVAEPAAEAFKPIPSLAAAIDARRTPDSTIAIRGAAGSYALIFYTKPPVLDVDDTHDGAFVKTICANADLFLVTRAADVQKLSELANAHGRHSKEIARSRKLAALHVDGPSCVAGSGGSM